MDKEFYEKLESKLERMTNRTRLFRVLKESLGRMGYWKNKQRGDPYKGYRRMKDRNSSSRGEWEENRVIEYDE